MTKRDQWYQEGFDDGYDARAEEGCEECAAREESELDMSIAELWAVIAAKRGASA